jgi:hypothetical protein
VTSKSINPNQIRRLGRSRCGFGFARQLRHCQQDASVCLTSHHPCATVAPVTRERLQLKPGWRLAAFASAALWLLAITLCTAHCALGKNSPGPACSSSQAGSPCHGDTGADSDGKNGPGSFCFTIKSLFPGDAPLTVDAPPLADPLPAFTAYLDRLSHDEPCLAPPFRQSYAPDRVFTPEVSLGPAFRSHAPPCFS